LHHPSTILLPKTHILDHEVLKIHANIDSCISALNVRESPKFSRVKKIGVGEHNDDVRFLDRSKIMAVSRMRIKNAI